MASAIRFPAMPAGTPEEQLQVLYRYLYQLTEQLNVELDRAGGGGVSQLEQALASGSEPNKNTAPKSLVDTYNQLKTLIIKTATEVDSSTRRIVFDITDGYRAQSEFGTYSEYLNNEISLGADGVLMNWSAQNGITTPVGDFGEYQAESSVYMQLGIVRYNDDGTVEAGVVIGKDLQRVTVDGKELVRSENIYCLLKADSLSFWRNGIKLSEYGLYDFFANKAYINEVYTSFLATPDFGTQLVLQDGVMSAIAANAIVAQVKAGSTVEINKDKVLISTPEFRVSTSGAYFNIPGSEDGSPIVEIGEDGLTAGSINAREGVWAPNIRELITEDHAYTVGTGGDYPTLQAVFDTINDKALDGDIVISLLDSVDAGGTLRGVVGSGKVIITPVNLLNIKNFASIIEKNAATPHYGMDSAGGEYIYVQADSRGLYRRVAMEIGRIGALGLRGKKLSFRCSMNSGSATNPALPEVRFYCGQSLSNSTHITSLVRGTPEGTTPTNYVFLTTTFTVPETAADDDMLWMRFQAGAEDYVEAGASAFFRYPVLVVGDTVGTNTPRNPFATVSEIRIENCSARTYLHHLIFRNDTTNRGLSAFDANVSVNRCTFNGTSGFRLWGGSGAMYNCYGACVKAADARGGGAMEIFGTAPSGTKTGMVDVSNMLAEAPEGETPTDTPKTVEIAAKATGTYSGSAWWNSDAALRQGWTTANHKLRGAAIFELPSDITTVKKAILRLKRVEGYGKGGNVDVKIYGTRITALSGAPDKQGSAATGTIAPGAVKSFDVTGLVNAGYKAFVLEAVDSAVMDGKTYSTNFARFSGTGSKTNCPRLTVTY